MSYGQAGMVIFAKDTHRVAEFYQSVLDLTIKGKEQGVVRLESGCLQLIIHNLPEPVAAKITIENPPKRRRDTAIKPVFFVETIDALRQAITQHGGELNPPDKIWKFDEHRACDGCDCEGNVFQLREAFGE